MSNQILRFFLLISVFSKAQELASFHLSECDADSYLDLVGRRYAIQFEK